MIFHERNLHSDLAFAFVFLKARDFNRDEDRKAIGHVRLTLDKQNCEARLTVPTLTSQGRSFPYPPHTMAIKHSRPFKSPNEVVPLSCQASMKKAAV